MHSSEIEKALPLAKAFKKVFADCKSAKVSLVIFATEYAVEFKSQMKDASRLILSNPEAGKGMIDEVILVNLGNI